MGFVTFVLFAALLAAVFELGDFLGPRGEEILWGIDGVCFLIWLGSVLG